MSDAAACEVLRRYPAFCRGGPLVPLGNRTRVRIGPLTAEITARSAERLALREGEVVVASFKATGARLLQLSAAPLG